MEQRYLFDRHYGDLFTSVGIPIRDILRRAHLPEDLFSRKRVLLTKEETFRFMKQAGKLVPANDVVVQLGAREGIEMFSPPVFAAYCSNNGIACVERLAKYKRLVCPLIFSPQRVGDEFDIEIRSVDWSDKLPAFWAEVESVFILNLIRKAVKEHIVPLRVEMQHDVVNPALLDFYGCPVMRGVRNVITLTMVDALKPFVSENEEMWQFFEPELVRRLSELESENTMRALVRNMLVEMLPSGDTRVEEVSDRLGISKRTLQRKLYGENTSFQEQLREIRILLATHYIKNEDLETDDIAFLLGYQDSTSFLRAFSSWTGMSIQAYRVALKEGKIREKEGVLIKL